MPRDYSRGACTQCAKRRKKCGEEKAACGFCMRLELVCVYLADNKTSVKTSYTATNTAVIPSRLGSPIRQVRLLQDITFSGTTEELIVSCVPSSVLGFFTTATNSTCRDVHALRQLLLAAPVVRDAAVACFSIVLPLRTNELGQLHRQRMGRALQTIRTQLSQDDLDRNDTIALQLSIVFIGLIESAVSELLLESMHHRWALAVLVGKSTMIDPAQWQLLPRSLYMLILEALAYHMTVQALFCRDIESVWRLWQYSGVYAKLTDLNPESPQRVQLSPLLGGQYEIYQLTMHVTRLHRPPHRALVTDEHLDSLHSLISFRASRLPDNLQSPEPPEAEKRSTYLQIYLLFCDALLICVTALRSAGAPRARQLDALVATGLSRFLQLPVTLMNNAPTMGPVQVLACAVCRECDFQAMQTKFSSFKVYLDPGHLHRAQRLFNEVAKLRNKAARARARCGGAHPPVTWHQSHENGLAEYDRDFPLPPGMALLSRSKGVFMDSAAEETGREGERWRKRPCSPPPVD